MTSLNFVANRENVVDLNIYVSLDSYEIFQEYPQRVQDGSLHLLHRCVGPPTSYSSSFVGTTFLLPSDELVWLSASKRKNRVGRLQHSLSETCQGMRSSAESCGSNRIVQSGRVLMEKMAWSYWEAFTAPHSLCRDAMSSPLLGLPRHTLIGVNFFISFHQD